MSLHLRLQPACVGSVSKNNTCEPYGSGVVVGMCSCAAVGMASGAAVGMGSALAIGAAWTRRSARQYFIAFEYRSPLCCKSCTILPSSVSIDNGEIGIGILKASEYHQQFPIPLYTYCSIITTTPISRFQQTFYIYRYSSADDDSTSWIKLNAQNELYWHAFIFFAVCSSTLGPFLSSKPDAT